MNALRAAFFGSVERPWLKGFAPAGGVLPMAQPSGIPDGQARGQPKARGPDDGGGKGFHGGDPQKRGCTTTDVRHAQSKAAGAVREMNRQAARLKAISEELDTIAKRLRDIPGD